MKKKLIIAAVVIAAIALLLSHYILIETRDELPEDVRLGWLNPFRRAAADVNRPPAFREAAPSPEPTPEPTPVPTPEPIMQAGSRGDEVKALQNRLRELGFMTGGADGVYGPMTEDAVKALRQYLDGIARSETPEPTETTEFIETIATQDEAAPTADAFPTEDEPEPDYPGTVDQALWDGIQGDGFSVYRETVKAGAQGPETKRLQTRLIALGYLSGGADGLAGRATEGAILAFQSANGLRADGVAGEKTQTALFSAGAKKYVKAKGPFVLKVSTKDQRVYAYGWSGETNSFSNLARTMVCSTGLSRTPTPKGTFRGAPVTRWGYFPKFGVWAQYLYRINGPILFHSVLYNSQSENSLIQGSVYKLGSKASHGCVRLSVADAKWIYENCPSGTSVTVY